MRTSLVVEASPGAAWLESSNNDGRVPLRADILECPFTIGRNEACDLSIDNTRISREHLRIERSTHGYTVQDLGSTNGTYVNGVRVTASPLHDGDLLAVANIGLIFHAPATESTEQPTRPFTQPEVHAASRADRAPVDRSVELVEAMRRVQELTLLRAVRSRMQPIVDVADGEPIGYAALSQLADDDAWLRLDAQLPRKLACRTLARAGEMFRQVVVEQAWSCFGDVLIFLPTSRSDVADAAAIVELIDSLDRLRRRPGAETRLVLQLPEPTEQQLAVVCEYRDQLRDAEIALSIDHFRGGVGDLDALCVCQPDYLLLDPSLLVDVQPESGTSARLGELVEAADRRRMHVIACGVDCEDQWLACKSAGIRLARGAFAAAALSLDSPSLHPSHASKRRSIAGTKE